MNSYQLAWTLTTTTLGHLNYSAFVKAASPAKARQIATQCIHNSISNVTDIRFDRARQVELDRKRWNSHYITAESKLHTVCDVEYCPCHEEL